MANNTPGSASSLVPLSTDVAPLRLRQAFDATAADRAALPADEVLPVRIDVVTAVVTTLGCVHKVLPYRGAIASGIAMFDLAYLDKLEPYALALMESQTQYNAVAKPSEPIEPLSKELVATREMLLADVTALEARKLIDGRRGELRGAVGYKAQATDVLLLASVLRAAWPKIEGKSAATQAELDHATLLAERMLTALGVREQGPKLAQAEADVRDRAYTLFVRAHDQVRRVIAFLRWDEDDLEEVMPTVFGGKPKPGKAKAQKEADAAGAASPASTGNGSNGNGTSNGTGNGAAKPASPAGSGLAGSDPFVK